MSYRVHVIAPAIMVVWSNAAFAQGPYVAAAVLADVVRSTHTEYPGAPESSGGGEAIGFALRAGTRLGTIWGVEVEFARPGEIEHEIGFGIGLPESPLVTIPPVVGDLPGSVQVFAGPVRPGITYRVESRERNTTLSGALWLEQQLTGRVAMVYLGGIAFSRSEFENEVSYVPIIFTPALPSPLILPPMRTQTIIYGVQPMVGIESRIEMTGNAHLVPGLRMHASDGRWLIRPAVAIAWRF